MAHGARWIAGPILPSAGCSTEIPKLHTCNPDFNFYDMRSVTDSKSLYRWRSQNAESISNFPHMQWLSAHIPTLLALDSWKGSHFRTILFLFLYIVYPIAIVYPYLNSLPLNGGYHPLTPNLGTMPPVPLFKPYLDINRISHSQNAISS